MILKHYSNRTCSDLNVLLNKWAQERLQLHLNIHTHHGYNDQFDKKETEMVIEDTTEKPWPRRKLH